MRIEFTGEYAALMGGYVAFRQNLGFVMPESSQRWLRHMADLLYTMPLISEVIDMERAEAIASRREGESDVTRQSRFVVLRQFCLYLNRIGVGAYVPPAGQVRARSEFVPRIVSEREMARIIEVAEGKALRWPPMVLKILWCTGIRIGEAAALTVGDFHRKDRSLYVAHAKSDRSRIVPVSESLAAGLGNTSTHTFPAATRADGSSRGGAREATAARSPSATASEASTGRPGCSPTRAGRSAPTTSAIRSQSRRSRRWWSRGATCT